MNQNNDTIWETIDNLDNEEALNDEELDDKYELDSFQQHSINMAAKAFCRTCTEQNIPVFVCYYIPGKGYKYRATFPEEIDTPEVSSQFGKFKEFLRVCIGFNKKDYLPNIN